MADGDVVNETATSKTPREAPSPMLSAGRTSLRDVQSSGVFDSTSSKYTSENYRRAVGASYVLTMGVSGIVLVALASSLMDLAIALDKTSVAVSGYIYVASSNIYMYAYLHDVFPERCIGHNIEGTRGHCTYKHLMPARACCMFL